MTEEIFFTFELVESHDEIRKIIKNCEGRHIQQVAYSTYEDAITQICFICGKVRSTYKPPAMKCGCEHCKRMKRTA